MPETKNDAVLQITLLASELTTVINALDAYSRWLEANPSSDLPEAVDRLIAKQRALAGRLDDIR